MSESKFKKLFEPTQIGQKQFKNRIVMPPLGTNYAADKGYFSQRLIDYHKALAKGVEKHSSWMRNSMDITL